MAFEKGQSGNPAGRPRGRGKYGGIRVSMEAAGAELVEKIIAAARGGDLVAARWVLDRLIAPLRAIDLPITVETAPDASPADKAREVVSAILSGKVAPDVGGTVLAGMLHATRIVESGELIARIEAIEKSIREGQIAWQRSAS